jgi:opacity protein-like surface antigen
MGKDRAGEWIDSLAGNNKDLEKRFGVDRISLSRPGGPNWEENTQHRLNYREKMIEGARNDYDLRRTLEAAAMSGKKKANKILDKGFNSVGDLRNAQNFSEKAARRHGQGGAFDSASDYMGLTQSMVERDRHKFENSMLSKMEEMQEGLGEVEEEIDNPINGPIGTRGGRENNIGADVMDDYDDAYKLAGIGNGYYSTGGEGQASTEASTGDFSTAPKGASEQLADFQAKVRTGMALAGVKTRGPESGIVPGDGF